MSLIVDMFCCHAGEHGRPPIGSDSDTSVAQPSTKIAEGVPLVSYYVEISATPT